jgi:pyruvate formate lyase activating enzyme
MDEARHRQFTGVSNRVILANLKRLARIGSPVIVRIPLIPGLNDDAGNLRASARWLAGLGGIRRVDLLPYHPGAEAKYARLGRGYPLAGARTQSPEQLEACAAPFRELGLDARLGG